MTHTCLLLLGLLSLEGVHGKCPPGFNSMNGNCIDANECEEEPSICGNDTKCFNTEGNYYCLCNEGYETDKKRVNFTPETGETCRDVDECQQNSDICGPNAECINTIGSYNCSCRAGFVPVMTDERFKPSKGLLCVANRDEYAKVLARFCLPQKSNK